MMYIDCLAAYEMHRERGDRPALLESLGPCTPSAKQTILGKRCVSRIEVREGICYRDDRRVGSALSIFEHLKLFNEGQFFPVWIGFFTYEFARYFSLPTRQAFDDCPDAVFHLYEDGIINSSLRGVVGDVAIQGLSIPACSQFSREEFLFATHNIQNRIQRGDVYQVNLSQQFAVAEQNINPVRVYKNLRTINPSPFMGLLEGDDWAIVSGSPERLFRYHDDIISTRPIAGTRPRGATEFEDEQLAGELLANVKERAEHVMLVDLLRNDLARVSKTGSTRVTEAMTIERYSHVMHLVSEVQSRSRASLAEVFQSIFPGGTITGTPKENAMKAIAELEPVARGPYTGSMGYVSSGCGADFNILIRSLVINKGKAFLSAGAGIVQASQAEREYDETQQKTKSVRYALSVY